MAKIPDGILGKFLGKAGPVSGYMWNGINVLRTSSREKDNKITPKRTAQREKMKVCNKFTKAFSGTGYFNTAFPSYGDSGTGYNRATSSILNLAIAGNYPAISISYPLVLVSKGPLPPAENAHATAHADGNIFFSWTDNTGTGAAKGNDKVIMVAYFPDIQQAVFSWKTGKRADENAVLDLGKMKGLTAETWIGFLSNDGPDTSNSVYTERIS